MTASQTCIVAIAHKGDIFIGGDSGATAGTFIRATAQPKVYRKEKPDTVWLFGFSGAFRFTQLVVHMLVLPEVTEEDKSNLHKFMVSKFVPSLMKCLTENGYNKIDEGRATLDPDMCIVCLHGTMFMIEGTYQVIEHTTPYMAIGSGAPYAYGSLFSTEEHTPQERITIALQAAAKYDSAVLEPFTVLTST